MLGKPHKKSAFPRRLRTNKDGFGLKSEREGLIRPPVLTVSSTADLLCWPAIVTDAAVTYLFPNQSVTSVLR